MQTHTKKTFMESSNLKWSLKKRKQKKLVDACRNRPKERSMQSYKNSFKTQFKELGGRKKLMKTSPCSLIEFGKVKVTVKYLAFLYSVSQDNTGQNLQGDERKR